MFSQEFDSGTSSILTYYHLLRSSGNNNFRYSCSIVITFVELIISLSLTKEIILFVVNYYMVILGSVWLMMSVYFAISQSTSVDMCRYLLMNVDDC